MTDDVIGRAAYARWCDLLGRPFSPHAPAPADRAAALPSWCVAPLIATEAARQRLRDWSARAAGDATPVLGSTADVIARLVAFGDATLLEPLAEAIARIPAPPVQALAVHGAAYVLAGRRVLGWCGGEIRTGARVVVLTATSTAAQFERLALHEIAHLWLLPASEVPDPGALYASAVTDAPHVPPELADYIAEARAAARRDEDDVERLLAAWGVDPVNGARPW
ncbi:MAG: hypothetical protein AB7H93_16535 [Vicinamibacterales bacterium]